MSIIWRYLCRLCIYNTHCLKVGSEYVDSGIPQLESDLRNRICITVSVDRKSGATLLAQLFVESLEGLSITDCWLICGGRRDGGSVDV